MVQVLSAASDMTVIGEARDGSQAIDLCLSLRPDVITMDIMMPVVSGLAATEHIMAYCPTPIVVVSGSGNRGEVFETYDALSAGALEVIEKPRADESLEVWERRLIETVRIASRVRVITHPRGRLRRAAEAAGDLRVPARAAREGIQVVAIGASTGGPKAVVEILQALPSTFPIPILVATHISESFSAAFAEWLAANSPLPVRLARHDDPLEGRGVRVAPADKHLVVDAGRLQVMAAPPRHSCRPSVDVLFESVARHCGAHGAGVLLTGMGTDGAEGLLAIRRAGGVTLAQDEASCVIFGMPAEAIRLGGAEHVLPPSEIGAFLRGLAPTSLSSTR